MTLTLRLPPGELATLELQVRAATPVECCGALLGTTGDGLTVAAHWLPLTNSDRRPGRFSIPDRELRRARRIATTARSDVVAILHSHPSSPAQPSRSDREGLRISKVPWVIVAPARDGGLEIEAFGPGNGSALPILIDNG